MATPVIHGDQPWPHGSEADLVPMDLHDTVIHGDQPWPHGSDTEEEGDRFCANVVIHGDQPWPHGSLIIGPRRGRAR